MNHFADWTQEEWLAVMLPRHGMAGSGRSLPPHELRAVHVASQDHLLPSTVDYRGTGADSPVKDQAACGSCWVGFLAILSSLAPTQDLVIGQVVHART